MEIIVPRKKLLHPLIGFGQLLSPEGDVLWESPDWIENTLTNEGEEAILNTFYREQANVAKYLALIEGGTAAPSETSTMGYLGGGAGQREIRAPTVDGYNRQQITAGNWGAPALDSGDFKTTAAQKTFGPASGSDWLDITHVALVTAATGQASGSGKLLNFLALGGATDVAVGQSFLYTISVKAS
jgi:hypothetical protein